MPLYFTYIQLCFSIYCKLFRSITCFLSIASFSDLLLVFPICYLFFRYAACFSNLQPASPTIMFPFKNLQFQKPLCNFSKICDFENHHVIFLKICIYYHYEAVYPLSACSCSFHPVSDCCFDRINVTASRRTVLHIQGCCLISY